MDKGYVQVYTGNGKGKTTAALGLSLRAVCAGKKVYFGQFIKGMDYSELKAVEFLPNFTLEQFGKDCFIYNEPTREDIAIAKEGLKKIAQVLKAGEYDIVVLDEINVSIYFKLITSEEVIDSIRSRASHVEVICTGRYASPELIEYADLVTEMSLIKHYYETEGVQARVGIEK